MNTSEHKKAKWLNPNCQPTTAQTMRSPPQESTMPPNKATTLTCADVATRGENESCNTMQNTNSNNIKAFSGKHKLTYSNRSLHSSLISEKKPKATNHMHHPEISWRS
jgi:hypothetical protein